MSGRFRWLVAAAMALAAPVEANERLFVLSDIGNEPDDQMSLVRLLLYANEIDIEGFAATTSTWQRDKVSPDIALGVIAGYAEALPRLRENAQGWPDAHAMRRRVMRGVAGYGMAAIDPDRPSQAALALVAAGRRDDERPLWVALWGGANTLAEALEHARRTLPEGEVTKLVSRLRVYSISDQDDAGPWVRQTFPGLYYIAAPSSPDGADYARATWTGISGDRFYRNGQGADFTTVSNEWLDANIRKGPLGAHYPRYLFIMEGDTPSFLGLIPNGLASAQDPGWGGWSGRYVLRQPHGESRPLWTQGGDSFPRVTSADTVGETTSDQATIWRWRTAFQNDFAARIGWTILPPSRANHAPAVAVAGYPGSEPIRLSVRQGQAITLDASPSRDPDGQRLRFAWMHYPEAGFTPDTRMADLRIEGGNRAKVRIVPTATCRSVWIDSFMPCRPPGIAHVILSVTDNGKPALTRYRRIIIEVAP